MFPFFRLELFFLFILDKPLPRIFSISSPLICGCSNVSNLCELKVALTYAWLCSLYQGNRILMILINGIKLRLKYLLWFLVRARVVLRIRKWKSLKFLHDLSEFQLPWTSSCYKGLSLILWGVRDKILIGCKRAWGHKLTLCWKISFSYHAKGWWWIIMFKYLSISPSLILMRLPFLIFFMLCTIVVLCKSFQSIQKLLTHGLTCCLTPLTQYTTPAHYLLLILTPTRMSHHILRCYIHNVP